MHYIYLFKDLLFNPDKFFREKERKRLSVAILVVFLMAILSFLGQYLITRVIIGAYSPMLSESVRIFLALMPIIMFFSSLIVSFIIWIIIAGLFQLISYFLGGEGEFTKTLEVTAYGFIPIIFSSIINLGMIHQYLSGLQIGQIQNPKMLEEFIKSIIPREIVISNAIISIAFLLWGITIWIFGVKHARNLTLKDSAITVLIPSLIYLGFQIYSLTLF